jgi:cephalosporin-C deacetylase
VHDGQLNQKRSTFVSFNTPRGSSRLEGARLEQARPEEVLDLSAVVVDRPEDFEQFWHETVDSADAVPLIPRLDLVPMRSTPEVETYEIHYQSLGGLTVAGWYCRPRTTYMSPPYPALITMPGYMAEPELPKSWARLGYAAIGVAPRGKLRSNQSFNPGYPGLLLHEISDRHTYSYRGVYVDAMRAIDFALSRPEVDPKRIGIRGSSQGGALAIVSAALRPNVVKCAAVGAPFLAGIMTALDLTHSYPYEELNEFLRLFPEKRQAVRLTVSYFDVINFAAGVRCPILLSVGLMDDCCPPETGLALAEALENCSKFVHLYPGCAHDAGSYWEAPATEAFLASHLRRPSE